jgi:hypothetical protein
MIHAADRHVFVRPEFHTVDHQGLILDERTVGGRHELLVMYVSEADHGAAFTVWLSPARVRPIR